MLYREKITALRLRKAGLSYSQIRKIVSVSKSTLSLWLRDMPLSSKRLYELRGKNEQKIEKYRKSMRKKATNRLKEYRNEAKCSLLPLSNREILLMGLFLYWGEGKKGYKESISISNTDPDVIRFAFIWMTTILGIDEKKIRISLHLYNDMEVAKEISFWSKVTRVNISQFYRPYIKSTSSMDRKHAGFNHGTCNIAVCDVRLKERILTATQVIIKEILSERV